MHGTYTENNELTKTTLIAYFRVLGLFGMCNFVLK